MVLAKFLLQSLCYVCLHSSPSSLATFIHSSMDSLRPRLAAVGLGPKVGPSDALSTGGGINKESSSWFFNCSTSGSKPLPTSCSALSVFVCNKMSAFTGVSGSTPEMSFFLIASLYVSFLMKESQAESSESNSDSDGAVEQILAESVKRNMGTIW